MARTFTLTPVPEQTQSTSTQSSYPSSSGFSLTPIEEEEDRSWGRAILDQGVSIAASVPRAAAGLASFAGMVPGVNYIADPLASGLNYIGDAISEHGLSDYQKNEDEEFATAIRESSIQLGPDAEWSDHLRNIASQGGAAASYLAKNPAQAVNVALETLPYLFGGGLAARTVNAGVKMASGGQKALSAGTSGAIGEGIMAGGATTDQIVQEQRAEGIEGWTPERLYGGLAGLGTLGIGRLGNRIQGPADIDAMVAGGFKQAGNATNGPLKGALKGGLTEGAEELLQGAQEEAFVNQAMGRPLSEDVGSSAVTGSIAGSGLGTLAGGYAGAINRLAESSATKYQTPFAPAMYPQPPIPQGPAPESVQGPQIPQTGQTEDQGQAGVAPGYNPEEDGTGVDDLTAQLGDPVNVNTTTVDPNMTQEAVEGPVLSDMPEAVPGSEVAVDTPEGAPIGAGVEGPVEAPVNGPIEVGNDNPIVATIDGIEFVQDPETQMLAPRDGAPVRYDAISDVWYDENEFEIPNPYTAYEEVLGETVAEPEWTPPPQATVTGPGRSDTKPEPKPEPEPEPEPKPEPKKKPAPKTNVKKVEGLVSELSELVSNQKTLKKDTPEFKEGLKNISQKRKEISSANKESTESAPEQKEKPRTSEVYKNLGSSVTKYQHHRTGKRMPIPTRVIQRDDGIKGPKIHIQSAGPNGGPIKWTPKEATVLEESLQILLTYEGIGDKLPISIFKRHPGKKKNAGWSMYGGLSHTLDEKATGMDLYVEDLVNAYEQGQTEILERTIAHEIGIHGIMRMSKDESILAPINNLFKETYKENKKEIDDWLATDAGRFYRGKPNTTIAEEYLAWLLEKEVADIASGKSKTYSAQVKRYLRQVQAYLDTLLGKKYTIDQVAEMLIEAADRSIKDSKSPVDGKKLWSNSKDGIFPSDASAKPKRRVPDSPGPMKDLAKGQSISSAKTSRKQVASLLKLESLFEDGNRNLDLGGGKFDLGTAQLAEYGVESKVMDEYNRTPEHNKKVEKWVGDGVDTVTVANVLNVIKEPEARADVIQTAYDSLVDGGSAYFQVYYDSKKEAGETKDGYQNHKPLKDYLPEVQKIFPEAELKTVEGLRIIVAPKSDSVEMGSVTKESAEVDQIPFDAPKEVKVDHAKKYLEQQAKRYMLSLPKKRQEALKDVDLWKVGEKWRDTYYMDPTITYAPFARWLNADIIARAKEVASEMEPEAAREFMKEIKKRGYFGKTAQTKGIILAEAEGQIESVRTPKKEKDKPGLQFDTGPKDSGRTRNKLTEENKEWRKKWQGDAPNFQEWIKRALTGKGKVSVLPLEARNFLSKSLLDINDYILKRTGIDLQDLSITGLGGLKDSKFYLELRYEMMGNMQRSQKMAEKIYNTFKDNQPHHENLMSFLKGEITLEQLEKVVPKDVFSTAKSLREQINQNAQSLVRQGVLKPETVANNPHYLPRMYLKHVLDDSPSGVNIQGGSARPSTQSYARNKKDIAKGVRDLMGEIVDPGYLGASTISAVGRDIAIIDFLNDIVKYGSTSGWIMPDSQVKIRLANKDGDISLESSLNDPNMEGKTVSIQWLLNEAENIGKRLEVMPDGKPKDNARAIKEQMEEVASELNNNITKLHKDSPHKFKQYRQVPNSPKYGNMAGLYINKRIYNDLFGNGSISDSKVWKQAETLHGYWKLAKVPLNPPTIARNIMSNMVLQTLSGMSITDVAKYNRKAWGQVFGGEDRLMPGSGNQAKVDAKRGRAWEIAKKYGLEMQTFNNQEMAAINKEFREIAKEENVSISDVWQNPFMVSKALGRALGNTAGKFGENYQRVEVWQKLAVIEFHLDQGASDFDAFMAAQDALFDYSLLNHAAKKWRKAPIGSPFLSFTLLATRRLGQVVAQHPTRMIMWYAFTQMIWAASALLNDVDDEDFEKLHKALPDYIAKKTSWALVPLPWRDADGRVSFLDLSYIHPFGAVWDMAKNVYDGEVADIERMFGMSAAPLVQFAIAMSSGNDPFTGRPITNEAYPTGRQNMDWVKYFWRQSSPSFLNEQGAPYKTLLAILDKNKKNSKIEYGSPGITTGQGFARFLGLNAYSVNPEMTAMVNAQNMKYKMQSMISTYKRDIRNPNNSDSDREELMTEFMLQYQLLNTEIMEMLELAKIHPNLKIKDTKK